MTTLSDGLLFPRLLDAGGVRARVGEPLSARGGVSRGDASPVSRAATTGGGDDDVSTLCDTSAATGATAGAVIATRSSVVTAAGAGGDRKLIGALSVARHTTNA
jgi:hypothetical protein